MLDFDDLKARSAELEAEVGDDGEAYALGDALLDELNDDELDELDEDDIDEDEPEDEDDDGIDHDAPYFDIDYDALDFEED